MSSDAFELLVFFFMCIWMISTIYEQIKTGINDYHKSKEKIEKRNNELARQREMEKRKILEELRAKDLYRKLYRQIGIDPDTDSSPNKWLFYWPLFSLLSRLSNLSSFLCGELWGIISDHRLFIIPRQRQQWAQ